MRLAYAITGFAPQKHLEDIEDRCKRKQGTVDIILDHRRPDDVARVAAQDVTEVRTGPAGADGHVGVQLLLREGAKVERVLTAAASDPGWIRLHDPVFAGSSITATITSIFV
jgi:hypothetical protein